jgi:two-component system, chemotaxis family, protein-glutamate methylesterase/glutaminase
MAAPARFLRDVRTAGDKIRVMIVDDSAVIRHLIRQALSQDSGIEVVASEANGAAALARIPQVKPDVVTLDIEMPEMNGLETLARIRKQYPRLRTIMFSTLTSRGAGATFEALSLGADDYVAKAASAESIEQSMRLLRTELIPRIKQFYQIEAPPGPLTRSPLAGERTVTSPVRKPRVLAIGVSTGGPHALSVVVSGLPAKFPLPVLIVQHMPAIFTRILAERLQAVGTLQVAEADEGKEVVPGRVIVARGGYHMRVQRMGVKTTVALDQGPHENSCRPSVDVLFRSVAECYGGDVLSVVLTGMGSDGLKGTQALKQAGAYSLVQDEASSVVWGMPGAIAQAGLADRIVPLEQVAAEIVRLTGL